MSHRTEVVAVVAVVVVVVVVVVEMGSLKLLDLPHTRGEYKYIPGFSVCAVFLYACV